MLQNKTVTNYLLGEKRIVKIYQLVYPYNPILCPHFDPKALYLHTSVRRYVPSPRPEPASEKPEPASGRPVPASGRPEPASGRPEAASGRPEPASGRPDLASGYYLS